MSYTFLSIIIPVYNTERYLKKCVESVIKAEIESVEIILIDDGSTDSSGEICDQYAQKYPYIQALHTKNKGVSSARNKGIALARGQYLYFLDSDDFIESQVFHNCISELRCNGWDMLICSFQTCDESGKNVGKIFVNQKQGVFNGVDACLFFLKGKVMPCIGTFFIKCNFSKEIKYEEDIKYGEDTTYIAEIMTLCGHIKIINDILHSYRQINSSAMHKVCLARFDNYWSKKRLLENFKQDFTNETELLEFMKTYYVPHELMLCMEAVCREGIGYFKLARYMKESGINTDLSRMLVDKLDIPIREIFEKWISNSFYFYWRYRNKTYQYQIRSFFGRWKRRLTHL